MFKEIAKNFRNINITLILHDIFKEKSLQELMIETIQNRLYYKGEDDKGRKLKTDKATTYLYSDRTMDIKDYFNRRADNVTLKCEGDLYKSMHIILNLFGFDFDADFIKENGDVYKNFTEMYASKNEFHEAIMSLTVAEFENIITTYVIPKIYKKLDEII